MRNYPNLRADRYRVEVGMEGGISGLYIVPVNGVTLKVIASDGLGWDHVSVSTPRRCPTWDEMSAIKALFFRDDEAVMQLHPPKAEYVNNHPFCLHLWRPNDGQAIPLPQAALVGIKGFGPVAPRKQA